MPLFICSDELRGGTCNEYLRQIDKFISRVYRKSYIAEKFNFSEVKVGERQETMKENYE